MAKQNTSDRLSVDLSREAWDRIILAADRGLETLDPGPKERAHSAFTELVLALDAASQVVSAELPVNIVFDKGLTEAEADGFVAELAKELEFGDERGGRFRTTGWGMGRSRVMRVERAQRRKRRLTVSVPGPDGLAAVFGEDGADEGKPLEGVPDALLRVLRELEHIIKPGSTLALARDWEGFIVGMVEGDDRFEALAFTEDGLIGHGGVNLPHYVETARELLS